MLKLVTICGHLDQLVTRWYRPPATPSKSGREAPGPGALAAPPCCDAEVTQARSRAELLVKFPAGNLCSCGGSSRDPCCPPAAAHRGNRFFRDLQGPLFPGRRVWGGFTGPAQRSMTPASAVGKGLFSPYMTADTAVTKLAERIGQNLPKMPSNHTDILSCLLGLTGAVAASAFRTWL